jgi:arylsulfatase
MFTSDNGTSEPGAFFGIKYSAVKSSSKLEDFIKAVNNTLPNLGNGTSLFNYAAWGADSTASPFSGYKSSEYEAGTRVPFIVKEPFTSTATSSSNASSAKMIKAFAFVNDVTPTILEFARVQQPGSAFNGHSVHPIMGKSLKALFNGTADKGHAENDIVADEMFNNTAIYMGDWKAIRHEPPVGDGKWQLHNLVDDPTEINNVADQHPDIMQKLIAAYDSYTKDVGVVVPLGQAFYISQASFTPPVNQSQVTITSQDISPEKFNDID